MSEPLSEKCEYCGSPDVLDDAWFCGHRGCKYAYELDGRVDFLEQEVVGLRKLCSEAADKLESRGNEEPLEVARRLRGGHNGEAVAFMQAEKPRPNLPAASSAKPHELSTPSGWASGQRGGDSTSPPPRCAHKRCWRKATQAFDVGSWWTAKLDDRSNLRHYEVCDKHAAYFAGSFDSDASERVQRDLREWGTE